MRIAEARRAGDDADVLASFLDVHRLSTVVAGRIDLAPPWRLDAAPTSLLTLVVQAAGTSHLVCDSAADPIVMSPGDLVIRPHGTSGYLHDGSKPLLATRQLTVPATARPTPQPWQLAHEDPTVSLVICLMRMRDLPRGPLWDSLPATIHVPARDGEDNGPLRPAIELMIEESAAPGPASTRLLSRLAEILLILALREHSGRQTRTPGLRALADPVIAPAVQAIHADPGEDWTVAALASRCGLSRSTFARRFAEVVGETPLSYLTGWRVARAGHLLATTGASVGRIAGTVGYRSEAAFRTAFVSRVGRTPREYRRQHRARAAGESRPLS